MPSLPASTDFTGASVTESGFKTAIAAQREYLASLFGADGLKATALATMGVLASATIAKSSAYTVTAADRGKVILCTGTFTLSLTAAATLGDGFSVVVINVGAGLVAIDPAGSETIDGMANKEIFSGASSIVMCNGSTFYSFGSGGNSEVGMEVITASTLWTPPVGKKKGIVTIIGGAGGGGAGYSNINGDYSGGNGGEGGSLVFLAEFSGAVSITIGSGGSGSNSGAGSAGGTTSFGGYASVTGGSGGTAANASGPTPGNKGNDGSYVLSTGDLIRANAHPATLVGGEFDSGNSGSVAAWVATSRYAPGTGGRGETGSSTNNAGAGASGAVFIQY